MTVLPASLHFTNFKMLLALFLVLNGIAAQEPQAVLVDKLDKLLADQEFQETTEFVARKANNAIRGTDHSGSYWIQQDVESANGRE